jgi:hypothetical protein
MECDHVVPPLTGSAMAGFGATYTDVHYVLLVATSLWKRFGEGLLWFVR